MGRTMQKQGVEVGEDPGIFRLGKLVIFGVMRHWAAFIGMNGGLPKRLYPVSILHPWSNLPSKVNNV